MSLEERMRLLLEERWSYRRSALTSSEYESLIQWRLRYEEYQQSTVAQILAVFPQISGRVLDYGCGEGGLVVALQLKGIGAVGVDVAINQRALQAIKIAHLRAQRHKLSSGIFSAYDGIRLPYADASFDYVISQHVFEHVDDHLSDRHIRYLHEAKRVLKAGGGLLLTCPNKWFPVETHTKILFFQWLPVTVRPLVLKSVRPRQFQYLESVDGLDYPAYLTPGKVIKAVQSIFPTARFATEELYQLKLEGKLGETGNEIISLLKSLFGNTIGVRFYYAFGKQTAVVAFKESDSSH